MRGRKAFRLHKPKKALPFITATALSVALWTLFAVWIAIVYRMSYDLMTIIIGTLLAVVFACSTTRESIRSYREWRRNRNVSVDASSPNRES